MADAAQNMSFYDPTQLASMPDDDIQKLAAVGFDPAQVQADRAQAQQGLGIPASGPRNAAEAQILLAGGQNTPARAEMQHQMDTIANPPPDMAAANDDAAMAKHRGYMDMFNNAPAPAPSARPGGGVPMPGGMGEEKAAVGQVAEANKAAIEADLAKQRDMDQMVARHQRDQNVQAAQDAIDKAQWERDFMHHKNEAEDAMRQVSEMKVDPEKFYKNEDGSTNYGKKVGSALAIAMGAFGSALTRGPNFALEIVNKAVDDDIAAQRTNIAKAERGAEKKQEAVNMLHQQHREDTSDEMTHRLQAIQEFRTQLQDMASKTTDQQAKARAQQVDAAAAKQQADITHQYAEERANNTFKNRQLQIEEDRTKAATGRLPPAIQAKVANAQAAMQALARVEEINSKSGTSLSPTEREKGDAAKQALEAAMARLQGSGLSSRNKDIFDKMVGSNPASMGAFLRKGRYQELRSMLQDEMRASMAGGGVNEGAGLGSTEEQ